MHPRSIISPFAIAILIILLLPLRSLSADIQSHRSSLDGILFCSLTLQGPIERGDEKKFRDVVLSALNTGCIIEQLNVWSAGGDLSAALSIGEQVSTLRLTVVAPMFFRATLEEQTSNQSCSSACFFIWAAGKERRGRVVAVHRPYFNRHIIDPTNARDASLAFRHLFAKVRSYLAKHFIPGSLIDKLLATDSRHARYLTATELESLEYTPHYEELLIERCGISPRDVAKRAAKAGSRKPVGIKDSIEARLMQSMQEKWPFLNYKMSVDVEDARYAKAAYLAEFGN